MGSSRVIVISRGRIYRLPILAEGDLDLFLKRLNLSGSLMFQYQFLSMYLIHFITKVSSDLHMYRDKVVARPSNRDRVLFKYPDVLATTFIVEHK